MLEIVRLLPSLYSGPLTVRGHERLIEREREFAALEAGVERAQHGAGCVLVVEGQPGVGKTRLASAAAARAEASGMLVLRAAGTELEQDLAWGVVRTLLGRHVARHPEALRGAAATAAPLFSAARATGSGEAGPILHGLYWLVSDLATARPVAIVIDDVHFVDGPSARWLAYLCARVEDLRLLVVLAGRPAPRAAFWQAIASAPRATVLELRPLTPPGTRALVQARLASVDDRLVEAFHRATGGNPFLVTQLLYAVGEAEDGVPTPEQLDELRPDSIRRHVLLRLASLGNDATQLAFAVAILGQQATVPLAAELATLERDVAIRAADALAMADVIRIADGVRFVHPLVLGVVEEEMPRAQRADWHRRAAELLARRGAAPGQLAPHLLATDPGARPDVVRTLRVAAADALATGAAEVAARCLRRALAEPPPEAELTAVLAELGRVEGVLRDPVAVPRLREALSRAADPVARAGVARELATQLVFRGEVEEGVSLCQAAALDLTEGERELKLALLAQACTAGGQDLNSASALALETDVAQLTGDTPGERLLLAAVANARAGVSTTPISELCDIASRALGHTALLVDVGADSPQFWNATCVMLYGERYDEVDRLIDAAQDDSRRRGSLRGFGFCVCFRSPLQYRVGRLSDAVEDARVAAETFADEPLIRSFALSFLIEALIDQGSLQQAADTLAGVELASLPPTIAGTMLRGSCARLRRMLGDTTGAAAEMLAVARQFGQASSPFWPWRTEAALAAHAAGETERARSLAAEEVARAELVGSRWMQARALHALATVERSLEPLTRAEALTRGWPTHLERARILVELGAGLRRRGERRQATQYLREGLDLSDRCGAAPIAERADAELTILTGSHVTRQRRWGVEALTPSELRVCRMAARGEKNRDIAQALFVSLRTVETHLTHAYQKLGIESRAELPAALRHEHRGSEPR